MEQKRAAFLFSLLVMLFVYAVGTEAGDNVWTTNGPYGVQIVGLAIDPSNPQNIYASARGGNEARVYKSIDAGTTWLDSTNSIESNDMFARVLFDPEDSSTVYAPTEQGVYKSTDAGGLWERVSEFGGERIHAWSADISAVDGTLYVGAYDSGFGAPGGVYRSTDGGGTWERLGNGAPTSTIRAVAIAPSAPHIVYVGGESEGVFKTTDGGNSWQNINNGFALPPYVGILEVDPYDSQLVYMQATGGLYKTTNGGQSWTPIGSGLPGSSCDGAIAIDPDNQQVIYCGTGSGVYRSLDSDGSSWAPMTEGMGSRVVSSLAMDQLAPQNVYAGTSSGIWKYTLVSGPEDYSITINDGALFTNHTAVTLTLTAPAGISEMIISNDGGFGGATWESFTVQKHWAIVAYGSHVIPRIVYAKFRAGGQVSGMYQDDIVLDVTAPTGTVEITDTMSSLTEIGSSHSMTVFSTMAEPVTSTVYLPLVTRNYRPGFTLVRLLLSATDDLSGVSEVIISNNDVDFTKAQWEAYIAAKNWWVPDTGTTVVRVKFRDRAGNESEVYSDSITP